MRLSQQNIIRIIALAIMAGQALPAAAGESAQGVGDALDLLVVTGEQAFAVQDGGPFITVRQEADGVRVLIPSANGSELQSVLQCLASDTECVLDLSGEGDQVASLIRSVDGGQEHLALGLDDGALTVIGGSSSVPSPPQD